MKQKGIASFFSKPGQGPATTAQKRKEPGAADTITDGADGTDEFGVLKDGGLNRQGQKEAATSAETKKLVAASAGRLKRLKKVAESSGEENLEEALPEDLQDVEAADDAVPKDADKGEEAADASTKPCADDIGSSGGKGGKLEAQEPPKAKVHPFFSQGARSHAPKSSAKGPMDESKGDAKEASEPESRREKEKEEEKEEKAPVKGGDEVKADAQGCNATGDEATAAAAPAKAPVNAFFAKKGKEGGKGAGEAQPGEEGSAAMAAFEAMIKATTSGATKLKASAKDGVGAAAMAAAEQHRHFKPDAYITWKAGEPTPYGFLCEAFEVLANTSKRQEKSSVLVEAFRVILATRPGDLIAAVRLTANELSAPHEGLELGLGESTLKDVLVEVSGRKRAAIDKLFQESGSLGCLAVEVRSKVRMLVAHPKLTLDTVLKSLRDVAKTEGTKAMNRKKGMISKLLAASRGIEAGFVMKACEFKRGLRIGVNDSTLITALSHAVHLHKLGSEGPELADRLEETAQSVRQAFCECPSYEVLIKALLEHPIDELHKHCHFIVGVPVKPMLAKPTTGVSEVLDKFSSCEFTCEYKYDGERAQVHILEDGTVQVYSRNSESSLGKYPDAAEIVKRHLKPGVKSLVIDSEVVAFDRETGKIKPFQELSRRAKKVASASEVKGTLCVFPFDCLSVNGEILLRKPLSERRKALQDSMTETFGECQFAKAKVSSDVEELAAFLDESVADCTEGLMVKSMDATYEPSKRSTNWLKLKKDYLEGAADSFDVVPIGAWHGKGKRTGVYGSFLLAVYNPDTEEFQTISKIGTGFSEEDLQEHSKTLREAEIPVPRSYYRYGDSSTMRPEVWFDAKVVWEVKAADLSISPIHQAAMGMVESGKGISIRFPRLVKVRDDKGPEDATTAEQVMDMYRNQAVAKANAPAAGDDDDDF